VRKSENEKKAVWEKKGQRKLTKTKKNAMKMKTIVLGKKGKGK